jgi:predicted nucleic acid-binding protein
MRLVVDASVAAKWFNIEELSDSAVKVKDAHVRGDVELVAPIHIIYEVGNSIWRNPQLTDEHARDGVVSILRLGIELIQPNPERVSRAMEIARLRHTTFYDAIYLQAAEEWKVPILTADENQASASRGITKAIHLRGFKL